MKPKETIEHFDRFLEAEGLSLEAVVIGGVAMALLGVTSRQTKDCDVLVPEVPPEVADAARRFAAQAREGGNPLDDNWFNNGPSSLRPTNEELEEILPWLVRQDANPDWPDHVRATIADLGRRLGHGV